MDKKTYTAPAVIACTDAVQNTNDVGSPPNDGGPGQFATPGSIGLSL